MPTLKHFRFWCQSVLPLVYDDSLSYYEVLCRVVNYINKLIESDNQIIDDVDELKTEIEVVQKWINEYSTDYIKELVEQYLAEMILVGLTDTGYFVYYIPESWSEITFETTGLDVFLDLQPEYGHLVLSY